MGPDIPRGMRALGGRGKILIDPDVAKSLSDKRATPSMAYGTGVIEQLVDAIWEKTKNIADSSDWSQRKTSVRPPLCNNGVHVEGGPVRALIIQLLLV